jgi:hypothetical protein
MYAFSNQKSTKQDNKFWRVNFGEDGGNAGLNFTIFVVII